MSEAAITVPAAVVRPRRPDSLRLGRDTLSLLVGSGADAVDLFADSRIEVNGLRWLSEMPGGYVSCDWTVPRSDPLIRALNQFTKDSPVRLVWGGVPVWEGYLLPPEPSLGEESGVLSCAAIGGIGMAKRNEFHVRTWVDRDYNNWWLAADHNEQFGSDNQGQLLLYLNIGSSVAKATPGRWTYWLGNGMNADDFLDELGFTADVNVDAANWYAKLSSAVHPWAASWTTIKEWHEETDTGSGTFAVTATHRALRLELWSTSDVAATAATRYVKITDLQARTTSIVGDPLINEALWDIAGDDTGGLSLCSVDDTETLAALTHLAYRDPMDAGSMMADIASRSDALVDWAIWGSHLYADYRPTARARDTIALRRSDLADLEGADTVVGDYENAADAVAVLYTTQDETYAGVNLPDGTLRYATWPADAPYGAEASTLRVRVLDYSSEPMTYARAGEIANAKLDQIQADAYRGTIAVPLTRPLQSTYGAALNPGHTIAGQRWADRTYESGHAPLMITRAEADMDAETMTLTVGPLEERELYSPWSPGEVGVRKRKRTKRVKGKKRKYVMFE